jgi:Mn2+/Fe2+ NRAMP family transporter
MHYVNADSSATTAASSWGQKCAPIVKEIKMLLFWSMLAASTVGPGTVVVCAKAGTDFGLSLVWAMFIASVVAYTLQEAAARLSIASGCGLGQAMRVRYGKNGEPPAICKVSTLAITVGNSAYQANNFVGAMASIYALFEYDTAVRITVALLLALSVYALLVFGDVDSISTALGMVVLVMTVVFGIAAGSIGMDGGSFAAGMVPNIPEGAEVIVLSIIGTTAIPFNLFLASSLAAGYTTAEMQRGVGFSTFMAALVSVLIIVVGSGVEVPVGHAFTVNDLCNLLRDKVGQGAMVFVAVGLFAAAFSSALAVALGASLCAQELLGGSGGSGGSGGGSSGGSSGGKLGGGGAGGGGLPATTGDDREFSDVCPAPGSPKEITGVGAEDEVAGAGAGAGAVHATAKQAKQAQKRQAEEAEFGHWASRGWRFRLLMALTLLVAFAVAAADADTVSVILVAQITNGLLLPCLATVLCLCVNDRELMAAAPQTAWGNRRMLFSVFVSMFLA